MKNSSRLKCSPSRNNLARQRTVLALRRTAQANERTYNAWVRTGLSTTVTGLGIVRLINSPQSDPIVKPLGMLFLLIGVAFYGIGIYSYENNLRRLEEEKISVKPNWLFILISLALLATSVLSFVLVLQYQP